MSVGAVRAARRAVDGGEAVHGRRHALAARAPAPARTHATPRSPSRKGRWNAMAAGVGTLAAFVYPKMHRYASVHTAGGISVAVQCPQRVGHRTIVWSCFLFVFCTQFIIATGYDQLRINYLILYLIIHSFIPIFTVY